MSNEIAISGAFFSIGVSVALRLRWKNGSSPNNKNDEIEITL